ncbi:MAG: tetratricopeptide repeat protein [Dongiaceae bacterium]
METPSDPSTRPAAPAPGSGRSDNVSIEAAMRALEAGDLTRALDICERRLTANMADAKAIQLFGVILMRRGDLAGATEMMKRATAVAPNDGEMWRNYGAMLGQQGRMREAVDAFFKAIDLNKRDAVAYAQLGMALENLGLGDEAERIYRRGIDADPNNAQNWKRLGERLFEKKDLNGAIEATDRALDLQPGYTEALANLSNQLRQACDWPDLAKVETELDAQTADAIASGQKTGEPPMLSLIRSPDPARHRAIADATSRHLVQRMRARGAAFSMVERRRKRERITLGYLAASFHNHPDAHLCCGIFERHDRNRFAVRAYSFGPDDGSAYRRRIEAGCDAFVDLRGADAVDAAKRIYEDEVDILIGITGHTVGSRLDVCALRPAPLQVSFLDYPGTIGGGIFDYLVADPVVAPEGHDEYFTETLIRMPHCYQPNDGDQKIADAPTRRDFDLPDDALVLASFVNNYKIDAALYGVWMRLLDDLPHAVLWLLRSNDAAEENLRREAHARGVDPARLVFDGKRAKPDHLARLGLADLCLDTLLYNGHTTTSDALFAGVPVVTLEGRHFPGRVAGSILRAIGLPELMVGSLEEYRAVALMLATDADARAGLRQRIAVNRIRWPLFDTERYVRNLENGFEQAWALHVAAAVRRPLRLVDLQPLARAR